MGRMRVENRMQMHCKCKGSSSSRTGNNNRRTREERINNEGRKLNNMFFRVER